MEEITEKILKLYESNNFYKLYGSDFWIVCIFIFVILMLLMIILVSNQFNKVRQNWKNERCNPMYIPFAGFINPQQGKSNLETVSDNFFYCNNKFVQDAEKQALDPALEFMKSHDNILGNLSNLGNLLSGFITILKINLIKIIEFVVQHVLSVVIEIQYILIKMKDMLSKASGVIVTMIYSIIEVVNIIKLYLLNIIHIIVTETLISTIVTVVVLAYILLVLTNFLWWPPTYSIFIGFLITFISTLIFCIFIWVICGILNNFSNDILKDAKQPIPSVPYASKVNNK